MQVFSYLVLLLYLVALVYLTFYSLLQVHLLYYYKKYWRRHMGQQADETMVDYPFVTVQLPIYNEQYVIERLIDAVAAFDYPKDRYEIHILDDSNDETVAIVGRKVAALRAQGYQIEQVFRSERKGFKAGALKAGLDRAKGEFIAIFDADFVPRPDFLKRTVPHFKNPQVGVVQTRWEHINRDYSLLTRLQALQLNAHFHIEQQGRRFSNCFLQFNGTAGIWRRSTIGDAGGWESDTLTEDLDLSYRAQLRGWRIHYLEDLGSPAELPAEMNGLKSQQFRWMKGGAEVARKIIPSILRSKSLTPLQKIHGVGHLMSSGIFPFIFLAAVASVPFMMLAPQINFNTNFLSVFFVGILSTISVYYVANVRSEYRKGSWGRQVLEFVVLFPLFLSLSMGLSLHNAIAVVQGFRGKQTPFVRTPKFNIRGLSDTFQKKNYVATRLPWTTIAEGLLSLYFIFALVYAFQNERFTFIAYHALLAFGFGSIFYFSVRHCLFSVNFAKKREPPASRRPSVRFGHGLDRS